MLKSVFPLFLMVFILFSCEKDIKLVFDEVQISKTEQANITISYPKTEENSSTGEKINAAVEHFIINQISLSEEDVTGISLNEAIEKYEEVYQSFENDFSDSSQKWEVLIDGEVIYQSQNMICIAMNCYLDSGGAHGNSSITFLNLNSKTGDLLKNSELIETDDAFITLAKMYFDAETEASDEDYFFGEDFELPANIGFNENGIILLYNVYEIASYAKGITEFTIPYEEAEPFLKVH